MKIKEIIVVEGKSDITAVKRAFGDEVDVIATHGLGFKDSFIEELERLNESRGIIILTDPDYAGKRIRNIIKSKITNVKFAFIEREKSIKKNDIGVENASDEAIISAIKNAKPEYQDIKPVFSYEDIVDNLLNGYPNSKERRIKLCKELSIEYCNAKQLLIKLNSYGIDRQEFEQALRRLDE